ncbi:hypothetical protein [Thiocapsa rosea]|uniref:hypothetical protein n=1 Tax=Thiocapsa rosea TaxID=69360 RepID=UPI0011C4369F|nr:hypothetical protein [Thiocapsa rosea]
MAILDDSLSNTRCDALPRQVLWAALRDMHSSPGSETVPSLSALFSSIYYGITVADMASDVSQPRANRRLQLARFGISNRRTVVHQQAAGIESSDPYIDSADP